VTHIEMKS